MIEEAELASMKRKNRLADNNLLSNRDDDDKEEEEDSLVPGEGTKQTPLKLKQKMNEVESDEDDLRPSSQKKLLLDESEMEMNGKNFNIPLN